YPGQCLLEGTEVSEGRGTTRPVEICGAPYIDGAVLAEALAGEALPGVAFRPLVFTPTFDTFTGQACGGVQLHVTDRSAVRPSRTSVAIVRAVRHLWPAGCRWRDRAYEFVADIPAFDPLAGWSARREGIERGDSLVDLAATWLAGEDAFRA